MGRFTRTLTIIATSTLLALVAVAQSANPAPPQASVLQTGTSLVVVDVVVQDSAGHPIRGLKPENFQLTEDHVVQTVNHFDEHTRAQAAAGPNMPRLPAGTFTDYTPVPPNGALNILLLDALNTPMKDQSFVRYQLQQYVKHAQPGTRIAIFGLATRLVMLQGFTSNPETLKDAVDHKLIPRGSPLLENPNDPTADMLDDMMQNMQSQEAAANLTQFQAEQSAIESHLRLQYTLDAMNVLGHYLSAFPGRKNLIWFSGSFPINILPDATGTLQDPFAVMQIDEQEFRETTNLLAQAQVAVYPIDARGLMTNPVYDATNSGRQYARSPSAFNNAVTKFSTSQAAEHATMGQMALDTGGEAFYNTNGLAEAVEKAIETGSNYYTLAYTPTNRKQDGGYRQIHVQLSGGDTNSAWKLSYRHGYYAGVKPADKHAEKALAPGDAATTAAVAQHAAAAYAHAAMARGAPTPQDILFKVRVLPASTATEPQVAPDNELSPEGKMPGPYRRFAVDYVSLPQEFQLLHQPDGRFTGQIDFLALVYDVDGRLLNGIEKTVELNLNPDTYKRFQQAPLQFHMEVSAPTRQDSYLRIGIHDRNTNRFGVVEVPADTVSRLPPPVYPKPAASPATSAVHSAAPSTTTPPPAAPPR